MSDQIIGYYAFVKNSDGRKVRVEDFTGKPPLLNRRSAFKWINLKKAELDKIAPGFWDSCTYEIGFFLNTDLWPVYGNDRDRDLIIRALKREYELYLEYGYNPGGDPGVIFHPLAGEYYQIIKDSESFSLV